MRIAIIQHGNYRDAYLDFRNGGEETYRDQKASVDQVAALAPHHQVTTVALMQPDHAVELADGLMSIGVSPDQSYDRRASRALMGRLAPDIVICRTPHPDILDWCCKNGVATLPFFADILGGSSLRARYQTFRLRRILAGPVFPCIANHSLSASRTTKQALRQPAERIVPWDRQRLVVRAAPKAAPNLRDRYWLFYAGALTEPKGVGDAIDAIALMKQQGLIAHLVLAGPGDSGPWRAFAEARSVGDQVDLPGVIAHSDVRQRMEKADAVLVTSRHGYAEGLPNTLCEAFASRTPAVASDHPSFAARLTDGAGCLFYRASDPSSLAARLSELLTTTELYESVSKQSAAAHESLYVGVEWATLFQTFIDDPLNKSGWVEQFSLARIEDALAQAE